MRLENEKTALVVIDFQERFRGAVSGFDEAAAKASILAKAASIVGLPVVVTEQYPKGLGPTVEPVAAGIAGFEPIEKTVFSAARAEGFDLQGRSHAVVCGVETHVCVAQTVVDLLESGVRVSIAVDAVASRNPFDRDVALQRLAGLGSQNTTVEAIVFELIDGAGDEHFKEIQGLIK